MTWSGFGKVVVVIALSGLYVAGQTNPNLESGLHNFGSYQGGGVDAVNLVQGGVSFKIPLISYPQRGGIPTVEYFFQDTAKKWGVALMQVPASSGIGYNTVYPWMGGSVGAINNSLNVIVGRTRTVTTDSSQQIIESDSNYWVATPDGAVHNLDGQRNNGTPNGVFLSVDTSGFQFTLISGTKPDHSDDSGVLIDRNGLRYFYKQLGVIAGNTTFSPVWFQGYQFTSWQGDPTQVTTHNDTAAPDSVVDINGNILSPGIGPGLGADTLGRLVVGSPEQLTPISTTDHSGCSSARSITQAAIINFPGASGGSYPVKLCYASVNIATAFSQPANAQQYPNSFNSGAWTQVVSIVLPDGSNWSMDYDSYGNITSLTYPTGGRVTYQWQEIALPFCDDGHNTPVSRAVQSRTLFDGASSVTWQYSWGTRQSDGTITNIVSDPLGNDTAHVMSSVGPPCGLYETETRYYQGTHSNGMLLKTVDTLYSGGYGNLNVIAANVVPTTITTTLPNGKVSRVTRQYDSGIPSTPQTPSGVTTFGNVILETESDWGQGGPGAVLRQKATTYLWQVDTAGNYLNAGLLDLPASVVLENGSGNRLAETDSTYDETQYLTASNISTQHGAAPNSVRGNLTTVSKWLSTGGNPIVGHTNWYDTGEVFKSIDPLGNTTTHSYDPVYAGGYSTQTCNALNQCVSGTYDFNTGLLTSFTDANASYGASGNSQGDPAHTSNYSYDNMLRLTLAQLPPDPSGNRPQTTFNYPSPTEADKSSTVTATLNNQIKTFFDGLGRPITTVHASAGNATVVTSYDALGRVASVTNPYFSTSDPTYGVTQTQYDALGRITQITKPDGSVVATQYDQTSSNSANGNCTIITDEASHQRQTCVDALGRLIEADEPGSASAGNAATGSATIAGNLQSTVVGAHGATSATGAITISGNDPYTYQGSVTITGSEGFTTINPCMPKGNCPMPKYDTGTVSFSINGITASTTYGHGSTASGLAAALASQFSNTSVTARIDPSNSAQIDLTAVGSLSFTAGYGLDFKASFSGASLGSDSGNVSVNIDGQIISAPYSAGSTAASVAAQLVQNVNATTSLVTASVPNGGATITFTAHPAGSIGNGYMLAASVANHVSPAAFSVTTSGADLSGGQDAFAGTTVYDAGTVNITIGAFSASACYGPSGSCTVMAGCPTGASTATQVACALTSSGNTNGLNRSGSPVSASASGSTLSIAYGTVGTAGNVSVNITSSSSNSSQFPVGSFSGSGSLSGGVGPYSPGIAHPYATFYGYDALGNLLSVNQPGDGSQAARVRNFSYDSLSRLLTATNPESGQISYSYDADGNMLQKTSPAPNQTGTATQAISYCYDGLNRVSGKAYSAQACPLTSPVVSYTYDAGSNGIGHLTSLADQAGSGSYSYDALGRIANESRTIANITPTVSKTLGYTYNLDGSVSTLQYPSGTVVTYTPDSAGRVLSATDSANNINYVSNATYGPDSSLTGFVQGQTSNFSGIANQWQYNQRLQVCRITALTNGTPPTACTDATHTGNVLDIGYNFNLGANNGNVAGITNYRDTSRSQTFAYDALNRLTSAQNAGTDCTQTTVNGGTKYWGNSYSYDPWGNLLRKIVTKCSAESLSVTVLANNQLSGYGYDAAGNMTQDATTGNNYSYDAENRITGAAGYTYTYDADGNRVEKTNGTTGTVYWYMSPGIVAESDLTGALKSEYVFFDGERVARKDFSGGTIPVSYYFSDHLKTTSVITNAAGVITEDEDYSPWGGELQFVNNDANHYKFTGKERDSETGLDYFGARYYENALGRFTSPDWSSKPNALLYGDPHDPQSLNLYSYVRNIPTSRTDPNGHWCLFGHIGTTCTQLPPEPPPPPPPPVPAVLKPGTPQNKLAQAQDAARKNPKFQPIGQPGQPGRTTYCNMATCSIVKAAGASTNGLVDAHGNPNLANTDAATLPNSPAWQSATPQQAQDAANQGQVALGVVAEDGHGHIVTVRPELLPGTQDVDKNGPLINNIGASVGVVNANSVFRHADPDWYIPAPQQPEQ